MTSAKAVALSIAILATGMVSTAFASSHEEATYYDTIRPHGHPRSDAVYNSAVNSCYRASGQSRTAISDTPAFKQCMLKYGYRFEFSKVVQDAPSAATGSAQRNYSGPSVTISIGGGQDDDEANETAAENNAWAAQQESQDATDATNAGIAETVQGINPP